MARLRTAVIGVGHLGKEHARILAGLPNAELIGVADINAELAQSVARRLNCRAYGSYRPLLQLAEAAVIAVPSAYHHVVAGEFLHCGIPLLVEKPLAVSLEAAERLVDLAQRHHVLLQVGHIERFNPAVEELQRHVFQPRFIECRRQGPFTGRCTDTGVVLDLMIHDLDLLLTLVQAPVRSVEALGVSVFGGHEDVANARITFGNGCVANVVASRASMAAERKMHIWAAEGYAGIDFAKRHLTLIQPSEQVRQHGLDVRKLDPASRALFKDELFGRYLQVQSQDCAAGHDQLTAELQHFVNCVQKGIRPRVTGEDGREAIGLANRILHSIAGHAWNGQADGPMGPVHLPAPVGLFFQPSEDRAAA
jgi:predicted dehydrogenase